MWTSAEGVPKVHWFAWDGKSFAEADQMSHIYSKRGVHGEGEVSTTNDRGFEFSKSERVSCPLTVGGGCADVAKFSIPPEADKPRKSM